MGSRKRKGSPRMTPTHPDVASIYQDMLAEAGASSNQPSPDPNPRERKRPREKGNYQPHSEIVAHESFASDDDNIEFEDIAIPAPNPQTMTMDSEDEDSDEDGDEDGLQFEDVVIGPGAAGAALDRPVTTGLDLNLDAYRSSAKQKRTQEKRKPLSKAERERRVKIHQMHVCCLLVHCSRRNRWCDDAQVLSRLRPLLSPKIISNLHPKANLSQFGRTEALKDGLQRASNVFKTKFHVTERGLYRCRWAEDPRHLSSYEVPDNLDSCVDKQEFRDSAKALQGSRDVGAQLFCALLRSAGVRTRLVCSLQPLSPGPGAPTLPKPTKMRVSHEDVRGDSPGPSTGTSTTPVVAPSLSSSSSSPAPRSRARRRLGDPYASTYQQLSEMPATLQPSPRKTKSMARESPFPVYWVEVLDVAHQKWQPVDPVVTDSMWKPGKFEPPASNRDNVMSYIVAFEADGTARDVTKRYAKAFSAKTRRHRIEACAEGGEQWWRAVMQSYAGRFSTPLDQIEDNELEAIALREPMPRNVADFKDHPTYALERHLRRHEVLLPQAQPAGTVTAGTKGIVEKIWRRKDVRVAWSRDKWYRHGRQVQALAVPVKFLPWKPDSKTGEIVDDGYGGDEREAVGTPIFTVEQTDLYKPPPVRNGRIPKNKFGNIDVYAASMVPEGGCHVPDFDEHERAAVRSAHILGIDYAPALVGFRFKGRQGTAVLNGVVVAREHEAAVRAVMEGLNDVTAQREADRRAAKALHMWKRLLVALRIRERVYAGVSAEERAHDERQLRGEIGQSRAGSPLEDMENRHTLTLDEEDDDLAGGFFVE